MAERLTLESTIVASPDQVSSEVGDETVILGLAQGRYYGLNPVGRFIWEQVQTPTTLAAICDALVASYEVERSQAEADILALAGRLVEEGLVQPAGK